MIKTKITVKGTVQGVGFRYFCRSLANQYTLFGYVKNLHNGDVEIEVEGGKNSVNTFINLVKDGPVHSKVTAISVEFFEYEKTYSSFSVY